MVRHFRRRRFTGAFGRFKPARMGRNHFEMAIATTGGVESQTILVTANEDTTNRGGMVPAGAVMKKISAHVIANDTTPVTGKHQCFLVRQPGATTYATPIASWFNTAQPLTEEAIQIRQNALSKVETKVIIPGVSGPLQWFCRSRRKQLMYEGDDIVLVLLDGTSTNYTVIVDFTWIA